MIHLSPRLKAISKLIEDYKQGDSLADIGSDHAYLPVYLTHQKIIKHAYACDIAIGPLNKAKETINQYQVSNQVEARLGDGLSPVKDENLSMISISGMGGQLMIEILEAYPYFLDQCILFLQANTAIDLLREYLFKKEMEILTEEIVYDSKHIYEILVVKKGKANYNHLDKVYGPILRRKKDPLFIKKWTKQYETNKKILETLPNNHPKRELIEKQNIEIKELIQ